MVLAMDTGLGMLVSRRRFMTGSFNFVAPVPSFENNYWQGDAVRTSREFTTTSRASRMVYQYLGQFSDQVLATARKSGLAAWMNCPVITWRCCCWTVPLNKSSLMSELEKVSRG